MDFARPAPTASAKPASNYRWVVCLLLFVITTINYMDRNILGVLKPTIQGDLHFTETDFGNIIFFFSIAYALGYVGMGWLTDKIGIRLGLAVAAIVWCVASTAHGMVSSVGGFILARIVLGLGEGGNFPTCIKTIASWFPARDRALATGLFNSGSNIGAMLAPLIAALVVSLANWQAAFYFTGAIGLIWVVWWLMSYRAPAEHPSVTPSELAYIEQDPEVAVQKVPWALLLTYPGTWVYLLGAVLTNPAWWFYNNWVPSFLNSKFHVTLFACGTSSGADLCPHRSRLDWRRLDFVGFDQARHGRLPGAQNCLADLRRIHRAGVHGAAGGQHVAGSSADRRGHGGAPGFLRQSVHPGFGHHAEGRRRPPRWAWAEASVPLPARSPRR